MALNYRIVQFTDDPVRCEYRNIAVLVDDGKDYILKTADSVFDEHKSEMFALSLLSKSSPEAWTSVRDWIQHLKDITNDGKTPCGELHGELDRMGDDAGQLLTTERGVVEQTESKQLYEVSGWMARRLLGDPSDFEASVSDVLRIAEIPFLKDFQWSVRLSPKEGKFKGRSAVFDFGFVEGGRPLLLAKCLRLRYQTRAQVTDSVNAVMVAFDLALGAGGLAPQGAVVVSESVDDHVVDLVAPLSQRVHWIDITAKDASSRLREIRLGT